MPEAENQPVTNKTDVEKPVDSGIPPQYRGMHPDALAFILPHTKFVDPEKQEAFDAWRRGVIEASDQAERLREEQKRGVFDEMSKYVTAEERARYPEAQRRAVELLNEYVVGNMSTELLLSEERALLTDLKLQFEDAQQKNAGASFTQTFERGGIKEAVYHNLYYKLLFEALRPNEEPAQSAATHETTSASREETPSSVEDIPDGFLPYGELAEKQTLEEKGVYEDALGGALEVLETREGIATLPEGVPTMVLADIHGRRDFLAHALLDRVPDEQGKTVYELLEKRAINLVLVGDLVHSEVGSNWTPTRFQAEDGRPVYGPDGNPLYTPYGEAREQIFQLIRSEHPSYNPGQIEQAYTQDSQYEGERTRMRELTEKMKKELMQEEMVRNLGVLTMITRLIKEFPDNVVVTRGNHDDVRESVSGVSKYANESHDVRKWTEETMGEDFVDLWGSVEDALPLVAVGDGLIVSHTAGQPVDADLIRNRDARAKRAFMWTDNTKMDPLQLEANEAALKTSLGKDTNTLHVIGHRLTGDDYRSQCGGQLVQICNDEKMIRALVPPGGGFDPAQHIKALGKLHRS